MKMGNFLKSLSKQRCFFIIYRGLGIPDAKQCVCIPRSQVETNLGLWANHTKEKRFDGQISKLPLSIHSSENICNTLGVSYCGVFSMVDSLTTTLLTLTVPQPPSTWTKSWPFHDPDQTIRHYVHPRSDDGDAWNKKNWCPRLKGIIWVWMGLIA